MKISIIIPTYNEESTIERLMETLEPLNERCEILFVDGGKHGWNTGTFEGPVSGDSVPERKGKADGTWERKKAVEMYFFSCTATVKFHLQH